MEMFEIEKMYDIEALQSMSIKEICQNLTNLQKHIADAQKAQIDAYGKVLDQNNYICNMVRVFRQLETELHRRFK